jgi:hypothetical protein
MHHRPPLPASTPIAHAFKYLSDKDLDDLKRHTRDALSNTHFLSFGSDKEITICKKLLTAIEEEEKERSKSASPQSS